MCPAPCEGGALKALSVRSATAPTPGHTVLPGAGSLCRGESPEEQDGAENAPSGAAGSEADRFDFRAGTICFRRRRSVRGPMDILVLRPVREQRRRARRTGPQHLLRLYPGERPDTRPEGVLVTSPTDFLSPTEISDLFA